jgi:hypothetical protein
MTAFKFKTTSNIEATLCFTLCICASLNFGSWQVVWGAPFAIALGSLCLTRRKPFIWLVTALAVVLCPVLFQQSNNPHSTLFFQNIGKTLEISTGNSLCHAEITPAAIQSADKFCGAPRAFPAGLYVIDGVEPDLGLAWLVNHPLTPDMYYRIRFQDELVLVGVPAQIVEVGPDGKAHHRTAPAGDDVIRPIPRVLSYIGRWPHLLFLLQRS